MSFSMARGRHWCGSWTVNCGRQNRYAPLALTSDDTRKSLDGVSAGLRKTAPPECATDEDQGYGASPRSDTEQNRQCR